MQTWQLPHYSAKNTHMNLSEVSFLISSPGNLAFDKVQACAYGKFDHSDHLWGQKRILNQTAWITISALINSWGVCQVFIPHQTVWSMNREGSFPSPGAWKWNPWSSLHSVHEVILRPQFWSFVGNLFHSQSLPLHYNCVSWWYPPKTQQFISVLLWGPEADTTTSCTIYMSPAVLSGGILAFVWAGQTEHTSFHILWPWEIKWYFWFFVDSIA